MVCSLKEISKKLPGGINTISENKTAKYNRK